MPIQRITLADRFIACSRDPSRGFYLAGHIKLGPTSKQQFAHMTQQILSSQRIFVADDLVQTATILSCGSPSIMLKYLPNIQSLGDSVWIEWDEQVRLKQLHELGYGLGKPIQPYVNDGAGQVGFLIQTFNLTCWLLVRIALISYVNTRTQRDSILPHL